MATGVATIFFIVKFLSPADQGYYYTLNSLLALQVFIELGFNYSVVRIIGHELGALGLATKYDVLGILRNHPVLLGLVRAYVRQSVRIGAVAVVILVPVGLIYFHYAHLDLRLWRLWVMLVGLVAVGIVTNTVLSVLEGMQKIKQVAGIRLIQAISSSITLWLSLAGKFELYAIFISLCASNIAILSAILIGNRREAVYTLLNKGTPLSESKRKSDRKYFYKIAVSGVSGYLIFQIFTPILTMKAGPVAAGQFAMSLQIINAINAFGLVWLSTNAPELGRLIGSKQIEQARSLFGRILKLSSLVLLLLTAVLAGGAHYLATVSKVISSRVLPPFEFTLLLVSAFSNHVVFSWATYLRAHLDDPFWILSLVNAVFTSLAAWVLISMYGMSGATAAYFVSANVVGLVGGFIIYKRAEISGATA